MEIARQLENAGRLLSPMDRVLNDMKRSRREAYFFKLTNPVPGHLLGKIDLAACLICFVDASSFSGIQFGGLNPIFETVLHQAMEAPLTFKQASKVDYDEMRLNRRLQFGIVSWNSELGGVHDAFTPGMPSERSKNGRAMHGRSLTPTVIVSLFLSPSFRAFNSWQLFRCPSLSGMSELRVSRWMRRP